MRIIALHGFLGLPSDWEFIRSGLVSVDDELAWGESRIASTERGISSGSAPKESALQDIQWDSRDLWRDARQISNTSCAFEQWAEIFLSSIIDKPVLLGYSMGGRLALHALLAAPEKFSGAIIVSANPGLSSEAEKSSRLAADLQWSKRFRHDSWQDIVRDWNSQPILRAPLESQGVELEREQRAFDRESLAKAMDVWSLGRQRDLRAELALLELPILYVSGAADEKFTKLLSSVPLGSRARHVVLTSAGHRTPWDAPNAFRKEVATFLQRSFSAWST